jgi:hypothetical protein
MFDPVWFLAVFGAIMLGVQMERWRARWAWRARRTQTSDRSRYDKSRQALSVVPEGRKVSATNQLDIVMSAPFKAQRLLNKSEARILYIAEDAIVRAGMNWRVMAQVSLGEVLSSPNADAYAAINSKRVDLLIITASGDAVAAIEYQGGGHYQGNAPARDAVKKEALRRAGIGYVEMTAEHGPNDLKAEILRLAKAEQLKGTAVATGN